MKDVLSINSKTKEMQNKLNAIDCENVMLSVWSAVNFDRADSVVISDFTVMYPVCWSFRYMKLPFSESFPDRLKQCIP